MDMRIGELLAGIEKFDLVLPEFQREYVWEKEQAKIGVVSHGSVEVRRIRTGGTT